MPSKTIKKLAYNIQQNKYIEQKSYLFDKITQSRYAETTNSSPYEIRFPLFQAFTDIQNKSKVKNSKSEKSKEQKKMQIRVTDNGIQTEATLTKDVTFDTTTGKWLIAI